MGPEVNGPCNGFISNPQSDFQDWDCNWNINFGYVSGQLLQSYNPAVGSINTSKYSAKYTRVPDSNGEDVIIANFSAGSLNLSSNNIFRIQLYGPPRPFKISFQDPIKFDEGMSIKEISLKLNKILEEMILKNPDQWIWTHDRWKK